MLRVEPQLEGSQLRAGLLELRGSGPGLRRIIRRRGYVPDGFRRGCFFDLTFEIQATIAVAVERLDERLQLQLRVLDCLQVRIELLGQLARMLPSIDFELLLLLDQ